MLKFNILLLSSYFIWGLIWFLIGRGYQALKEEGQSMIFKSRCYNGGKQHNFQSRRSEKPSGIELGKVHGRGTDQLREFRKIQILQEYVYDICVWCGKTVIKG